MTKRNVFAVRNDASMEPYKKLTIFNFSALVVAAAVQTKQQVMAKGEIAEMFDTSLKAANVVLPQDEVDEIIMKATAMLSDIGIYEE